MSVFCQNYNMCSMYCNYYVQCQYNATIIIFIVNIITTMSIGSILAGFVMSVICCKFIVTFVMSFVSQLLQLSCSLSVNCQTYPVCCQYIVKIVVSIVSVGLITSIVTILSYLLSLYCCPLSILSQPCPLSVYFRNYHVHFQYIVKIIMSVVSSSIMTNVSIM